MPVFLMLLAKVVTIVSATEGEKKKIVYSRIRPFILNTRDVPLPVNTGTTLGCPVTSNLGISGAGRRRPIWGTHLLDRKKNTPRINLRPTDTHKRVGAGVPYLVRVGSVLDLGDDPALSRDPFMGKFAFGVRLDLGTCGRY